MSQATDYVVANAPGATVRADINAILLAIVTQNSGPSAPSTMYANMVWVDITAGLIKRRNNANSAWVTIATIDLAFVSATLAEILAGTSTTGVVTPAMLANTWKKGTAVASATLLNLSVGGGFVHVTGTTTTTGISGRTDGPPFWAEFDGAVPLTHDGTSFDLIGAASFTTAAGDRAYFVCNGGDNWRMAAYMRKSGVPLSFDISGLTEDTTPDTSNDFVLTYDASASGPKKVKPSNLFSSGATQIASSSASGSAVSFTSISASYSELLLIFEGVSQAASGGPAGQIDVQVSANNGSSWTTVPGSMVNGGNAGQTWTGYLRLPGYSLSSGYKATDIAGQSNDAQWLDYPSTVNIGTINAVRMIATNGNFDAGTIRLIGLK